MKKKILNNKVIMKSLKYLSNKIFNFLNFIIPINRKQIMFISFGGESIADSPGEIFNELLGSNMIEEYNIVWAVNRKTKIPKEMSTNCKIINANSLLYFYYLFRSNVWITNVGMGRGMNVQSYNRLYINTWHGTPLKKIGIDVSSSNFRTAKLYEKTYYCYQTQYEKDIFLRVFPVKEENLLPVGLPRNDALFNLEKNDVFQIKNKINLNYNTEIILYAPTWRNYDNSVYLDLKSFSKDLNDNQVILYRGHHAMSKIYSHETFNDKVIDVSNYASVTDLLIIADVLITDYSSIMVDYSILKRPILLFAPDYEEYVKDRGVYFDITKEFNCNFFQNQDDLLSVIKSDNLQNDIYYKKIRSKFNIFGGMATNKIIEIIKKETLYE